MRILVLGGAGYLGSVLVPALVCEGEEVIVFDRLYYGIRGLADLEDRVTVHRGDIRCIPPIVFDGVDAVINLAGLSNDPTADYNPAANYQMNTLASRDVATMCRDRGIPRFILASTCSIYDLGAGSEAEDVAMDENADVMPKAAYSRSKWEAERIVLGMQSERFCPTVLRMGTLFGFSRRMRYDLVVNTFVKDALSRKRITISNGGENWRPLCDVRDMTSAYAAALKAPTASVRGQIFNTSSINLRISEVALRVREGLAGLDRMLRSP
jgi:nucleoside-diphosphate-sugar epimerase